MPSSLRSRLASPSGSVTRRTMPAANAPRNDVQAELAGQHEEGHQETTANAHGRLRRGLRAHPHDVRDASARAECRLPCDTSSATRPNRPGARATARRRGAQEEGDGDDRQELPTAPLAMIARPKDRGSPPRLKMQAHIVIQWEVFTI